MTTADVTADSGTSTRWYPNITPRFVVIWYAIMVLLYSLMFIAPAVTQNMSHPTVTGVATAAPQTFSGTTMVEVAYFWGDNLETTYATSPASTQVGDTVEFRVDTYGEPYFGSQRNIPLAVITTLIFSLALAIPASMLYQQAKRREEENE